MGWTEYQATHFYNSGIINRKAECDGYFLESLNRGHYDVVKSAMKGSVYYGAIKLLKRPIKNELGQYVVNATGWYEYENIPENETEVFGVVILTYVDRDQFGYKLISESCGPSYYDCPKHILDALTPTNDSLAKEWRDRCYANASKPSISKLPIGSEIQFMLNGQEFTLRKSAPRYQFKTPFWINDANCTYFSKKRIPRDFKIITLPTK
jgi:hypothetical protein